MSKHMFPPASRPRQIRDRCPNCGHKLDWYDVFTSTGLGDEERWVHAAAECDNAHCGMEYCYQPNRHDRANARSWEEAQREDAEQGELL